MLAPALLGAGRAERGEGLEEVAWEAEGALRPVAMRGVGGADRGELGEGMPPVLLRVLLTGRAGRAMFGGPPLDGLEGRGRVVAMAGCDVMWIGNGEAAVSGRLAR